MSRQPHYPKLYVLKDGEPVVEPDREKWARQFSNPSRFLFRDRKGTLWVSTVFLGVDHNLTGQGPPVLFETVVFGPTGETLDMNRYETLEQAKAGHKEFCRRYLG